MRAIPIVAALLAAASARPEAARAQAALRGIVVDAQTGAPVAGAVVRAAGAADSARSGEDGRWRLSRLAAGSWRLSVARIGYRAREMEVTLPLAAGGEVRVSLESEALALRRVVVTASRRPQRLGDAPAATEVVTRREIEQTGAADLASVLTTQTGVQLEGGHPAGAGAMLEGLGSERVLVLLDGEPLAGRISGRLDLSRIPASAVERVEVVKGPQSTLYGTEAMGGVINVITRQPPAGGWTGAVRLTAGTQGRLDGTTTVGGRAGPVSLSADLARRSVELTAGQGDAAGALSENADALVRAAWSAAPGVSVQAAGALLDQDQRWASGQLFQFARNRQRDARLGAAWTLGSHRLSPLVHFSAFEHRSRAALTAEPDGGRWDREVQGLLDAELLYSGDVAGRTVDAGVLARREHIESDRVEGREKTLESVDSYAQLTLSAARWSLVPGVRLSWSEAWGTHWTPRVAAVFRPSPALALRASAGRGYRAPSFKELYLDWVNDAAGYAVHGNPGLRPETSTNLTAGLEWAPGTVFVRAQLFQNRLHDFIDTRETAAGARDFTYLNVQDGRTRGVEAEAGAEFGRARAEVGYGWLDAVDLNTGRRLPDRPVHSGRMAFGYAMTGSLRGTVTGVFTGAVAAQPRAGTGARDAFLRWNLNLVQALSRGTELTLGADNLFAARPEGWPGFTGRRLYVGFGWRGGSAAPRAEPMAPRADASNTERPGGAPNGGGERR